MKKVVILAILVLFGVIFLPALAAAQESRGAIAGQVTDPSGAAMPGVAVSLTNVETGQLSKLVTNGSGSYNAPLLTVGSYRMEIEVSGFKKFVRDRIEVSVGDRLQVDVKLEVGPLTESVTVTEGAPLIESVDSSLGQVVDSRRVSELPIAHGNPYQLIGLAPGTSFDGNARLNRPFEPTGIVGYSISGTRNNSTDVTMDGVVNTAVVTASSAQGGINNQITAAYVPPTDAMAEFKVQTSAVDAKIGQGFGAATNISLKSGTNTLHGTAYWSKMTPEMMARDFFATTKADFTYDRWGASLNGPVSLPKLYDGRNRTFFMWAYEGIKESRARPPASPITVPTEQWRQGDFSDLLALGSQYQIYNPFTRRTEGSRIRSDPFAGNIIPRSLINPVATKVLSYIPGPINSGISPDHLNNFPKPNATEDIDYNTNVWRVDHSTSLANRFYVRANMHRKASGYNDWFESAASGNVQPFFSRGASFDDVYAISPTTVLNIRYGYTRYVRQTSPLRGRGFDLTALGLPASLNNAISADLREFPYFNIRMGNSTMWQTLNIGEDRNNDVHTVMAAFTKAHNAHNIEFGHEFRSYRYTRYLMSTTSSGAFDFDETFTRGPLDNSAVAPVGQGMAAFLLGLPTAFTAGGSARSYLQRNTSYAEQSTAWMFYLQDTWRATRQLNLTLGVRYELEGPLTERYDRSVRGFDAAAAQRNEQAAKAAYAANPIPEVAPAAFAMRGGYTFAGVNGQPKTLWNRVFTNIMPRVGFAWSPNGKTVVRGAYGIFFAPLGVRRTDVQQAGFSRQTPLLVTNDNVSFTTTMSNPFSDGILEPLGSAGGVETDFGQQLRAFNTSPVTPYMQRWQLSVQREILKQTVVDLAYVGNRGTRLESEFASAVGNFTTGRDLNALPNEYLSKSALRDQAQTGFLEGQVRNPFVGLPNMGRPLGQATTVARQTLLKPYPQFGPVLITTFDGYSWYHSLQARVERRYNAGLTVNLGYTWSKFMEGTTRLNTADAMVAECVASQDHPHRLTVSTIYEIPFGRHRRLLSNANAVVDGILGGWQIQGIYTYQTGAPLNWGDTAIFTDGSEIARNDRNPSQWFNTAGFVTASNLRPDAAHYRTWPLRFSTLRSDGINNWDLSAIKKWKIKERVDLHFRGEFLNALNHTRFNPPQMDPGNRLFGTVDQTAAFPRVIQLGLKLQF
jgi:hypothetical protein